MSDFKKLGAGDDAEFQKILQWIDKERQKRGDRNSDSTQEAPAAPLERPQLEPRYDASGRIIDDCPLCHGLRTVVTRAIGPNVTDQDVVDCPRCAAPERWRRKQQAMLGEAGMADYTAETFERLQPRPYQRQAFLAARKYAEHPVGVLLLIGGYDTGKSTCVWMIANYWLAQGKHVWYREVPTIFQELRDTMRPGSEVDYTQRLQGFARVQHLILDDLGQERATDFVHEARYALLGKRLQQRLPTVITTNWSLTDLKANDRRLHDHLLDPYGGEPLAQVVTIHAPQQPDQPASISPAP